jgi:phosphoesterase RecJ-like protein
VITQADLKEFAATDEMLEGVANFLNSLEGYRAVLVLKEKSDGTVKGSLRTTRDDVDVAAIAKLFGGGGHRKAAGFTMPGRLVETEQGWRVEKVQTPVQS